MLWILMIMGLLVSIVIAIVVGGLVTPRTHVASRSRTIAAPIDAVWREIRDVARYADWRDEVMAVELVDADQPGLRWREITSSDTMTFGVEEDIAPTRFTARILDDDKPWGGTWTWELEPVDGGTRVTITERGYIDNPIFRFIGTHFIGFTRSMDKYLAALGARVE